MSEVPLYLNFEGRVLNRFLLAGAVRTGSWMGLPQGESPPPLRRAYPGPGLHRGGDVASSELDHDESWWMPPRSQES